MEGLKLKTEKREIIGKKVKSLRKEGLIPAVVYGSNVDSQSITVDYRDFSKVLKKAGENTLVDLEVAGKEIEVLIYDVQYHPVSDKIIAVDFLAIKRGQKITTSIDLVFVGVSMAVKTEGGLLLTPKSSLNVSCLPKDLIQTVEVDISSLEKIGDIIHIEDVKLPDTIEVLDVPKEVVALVTSSRESKVADAAEEKEAEVEGATEEEATITEEKK